MTPPIVAPLLAGNTLGSADSSFVVAEWRDAGGNAESPRLIAPWHVHHKDDEAWYVLEGQLRVRVGPNEVAVGAGASVFVPRGTAHTYWNPGPGPTRYLLVMSSNIFGLIQDIHAMKDRSRPALEEVFRKHDSELVEP
ncbi:MAG TPA: cupin domain-containing protein [Candidatus Dormibacteraeota bacterium]|jgi:mannose-6-phosphate isomerase-like protein (cupin superfamily)|nr:cupin domain-containing protein [Candidatus Dormibacteraeota bacterium]